MDAVQSIPEGRSSSRLRVKRGSSAHRDAREAVADLVSQIGQPDAALAVVFASPSFDREVLGRALAEAFTCALVCCTSAGEIAPGEGYVTGTLTGVSLASPEIDVEHVFVPSAEEFVRSGGAALDAMSARAAARPLSFGLLFVDGLALLEDPLAAMVHSRLGRAPLVGGSAGDGLDFRETYLYHDGAFHRGAACVVGVRTTLPFTTFMLQHFEPTDHKLVITESDPATRTVFEINGEPAAVEYARNVAVELRDLTPQVFAAHPVMLRVGGRYYVRSIQKVNPDGSLTFYCAIDTGLVLTVASPRDLVASLRQHLETTAGAFQELKLVLGFDCILRRLEVEQRHQLQGAREVFTAFPFIGVSTYGEQYNGLHVNHTLTGLALGG